MTGHLDDLWPPDAPYLALCRTFVQSMPEEWQQRFAGCLEQLVEQIDKVQTPVRGYVVQSFGADGTIVADPHLNPDNGTRRAW